MRTSIGPPGGAARSERLWLHATGDNILSGDRQQIEFEQHAEAVFEKLTAFGRWIARLAGSVLVGAGTWMLFLALQ